MDGKIDILNLLLLVLAVVVFLKLRSVLGRRTGHEQPPFDPYSAGDAKAGPAERAGPDGGTVITMPGVGDGVAGAAHASNATDRSKVIADMAMKHAAAGQGLTAVAEADDSFEADRFLTGAKAAYEMIVMAYAEGNRKVLKPLLAREVYDGFVASIEERERRKDVVETTFAGISRADIVDAGVQGQTARVTVRFVSELYSVTKRGEEIVDGDPKVKQQVTDVWTFAREVNARDPNWKLVGTQTAS